MLEIDDGDCSLRSVDFCFGKGDKLSSISGLNDGGGEAADLIDVDGGAVRVIPLEVVVSHTDFTKVTRVILESRISKPSFNLERWSKSLYRLQVSALGHRLKRSAHLVEVCSVVMLTTCETTTTGMFPVLSDSTVTG